MILRTLMTKEESTAYSINRFWKNTFSFHETSNRGREHKVNRRGVCFPYEYNHLHEIKTLPTIHNFLHLLANTTGMTNSEHLLATDAKSYVITSEHYLRRLNGEVVILGKSHTELDVFWKNTNRRQNKKNVRFPQGMKMADLKKHPMVAGCLYSAGILLQNEYLCSTDCETYLITNYRLFFPHENTCHRLDLLDASFSVKRTLFSSMKRLTVVPKEHVNWTGKYVIEDAGIASEAYINTLLTNRKALKEEFERERELKGKLIEERKEQYMVKLQRKEGESRRQREFLQEQEKEQEQARRMQREKIAQQKMFPSAHCSICGESDWALQETSPNMHSAIWECRYCSKTVRVLSKDLTPEKIQRAPIPKDVQREVWRRDQGRCVECGSKENIEFDHIIPISKGGANTTRNIQLLCQKCNRRKGANDPGNF